MPTGLSLNASDFAQQVVANLQASFSANILEGQTLGSKPSSNVGPWFDGTQWWYWNAMLLQYLPLGATLDNPANTSVVRNGNMQIAQRGTSFANPSSSSFTLDGYKVVKNITGGATASVNQMIANITTDGVNYPTTKYAMRIIATAPQSPISAGEYYFVAQGIERSFATPLFGNPSSLSLILRSNAPGTYCVSLRNKDHTWSYIQECVLPASGIQWFPLQNIPPLPTSTGDWGTLDSDLSYEIYVCVTAGSNFFGTANTWGSGSFLCTSNQSNLFLAANNYLDVTVLRHEPSVVSNPFYATPFDLDLDRCQRYYCKSNPYSMVPGTIGVTGEAAFLATSTTQAWGSIRYPTEMRSIPAVRLFSPVSGVTGNIYSNAQSADIGGATANGSLIGTSGFDLIQTTGVWTGSPNAIRFHYDASADI